MATATANHSRLADRLPPEAGWSTVEAPEIFKFDKIGAVIAGKLLSMNVVRVKDKSVPEYMIAIAEKRFKILGTYDLVQKLTRAHVGLAVRIKYLGENPDVSRNGNAMRMFDVQIKGTPAAVPEPLPIGDEDVPF